MLSIFKKMFLNLSIRFILIFIIFFISGLSNLALSLNTSTSTNESHYYVEIKPIHELGFVKGYVCFRIKAYTNTESSEFSEPECKYIKNSKTFKLSWKHTQNSVIGFQIYFGSSATDTEYLLTEVMVLG